MLELAFLIDCERDFRLTAQTLRFLCQNSELEKAHLSPEFASHGRLAGLCRLWLMWNQLLFIRQEKNPPTKFKRSSDYLKSIFLLDFPTLIAIFSDLLAFSARLAV